MIDFLVLSVAAFGAGLVDAVVGGGGLIQIPALFSMLPSTAPATLLGTSKLAGIWGTAAAAYSYSRRVKIVWNAALPAAAAALTMSFVGAYTVTQVSPDFLRKFLPFILAAVALYTFKRKNFGSVHAPLLTGKSERWLALAVGAGIGFYDGFFGPGTGSFLIFLFVRFFGYEFLAASAVAKLVNVACNFTALIWFGVSGHLLWQLGILMAVANIAGSLVGTQLAIRNGSGFVRLFFLFVVVVLVIKTFIDGFF